MTGPPPAKPIVPITPAPLAPVAAAPLGATPGTVGVATVSGETPNQVAMRHVVASLRQLGAAGPLNLTGTAGVQGVSFGIGPDEVVRSAQLSLKGGMSPALIPEDSALTVTLNGQYVGTIPARQGQPGFQAEMQVDPSFFQPENRLTISFAGRYAGDCNDPLSGLLWANVSETSALTLTIERLPPRRDLARLPQPFFDRLRQDVVTLPFVLPAGADNGAL
jgi:cellulose synthase (UDP-forming)